MMHPQDMEKVSITGPKRSRDDVIDLLHEMAILDIDEYDESDERFSLGTPGVGVEQLSDLVVQIRAVLERLPEREDEAANQMSRGEIADLVTNTTERLEEIEKEQRDIEEHLGRKQRQVKVLNAARDSGLSLDVFREYDRVDVYVGIYDEYVFDELPEGHYEVYTSDGFCFLFVDCEEAVDQVLEEAGFEDIDDTFLYDGDGDTDTVIEELRGQIDRLQREKRQLNEDINQLADRVTPILTTNIGWLESMLEKLQAPVRFATSEHAFVAEGWIPSGRRRALERRIDEKFGDSVAVVDEEPDSQPPVEHDNPKAVQPFESLTQLMAVPRYDDIDPTFLIMLTFPLFFGFMIGDAGYGVTTGVVFWMGMSLFPAAKDVFKSLLWASAATFLFGLAFGDAFGFIIFGEESVLAAVPGLGFTQHIPILFHRAHHIAVVFQIAALIGAAHVALGLLVGAYREYMNHGLVHAIMAKISWLVLAAGAGVWYTAGMTVGGPVVVAGLLMLAIGEGVEGIVEIPSLISNVLSYLRLFGVAVAAISLAAVVNSIASPLFEMNSVGGWVFGTLLLVVGHVFNTFIKIMEGFLQGIRLHYVELFNWFYDGGGRKYAPFGDR